MTYPRYWTKFPGQAFASARPVKGYAQSAEVIARRVEKAYRPGHTGRPYVQLVEETSDGYEVINEWDVRSCSWISPLVAAGFAPRSF